MNTSIIKQILIVGVLGLLCFEGKAQQDPMYSHYMFNTLAVNPGYAGSRDAMTVTAIARQQWLSIEGAPTTQTLTLHTPVATNLGLGVSIINDKAGALGQTLAFVDLAYHLPVGDKAKLSLGIKGGVNIIQAGLADLDLGDNIADPAFNQNIESGILPNVGAGLYYYRERFYAGVSVPKFLENDYNSEVSTSTENRHLFFITGAVFKLNESLKLKPTAFVKAVEGAPVQFDVTASLMMRDKFSVGAMYRSFGDVGMLLGYQFTDQFRAGYAFDYPLTSINNYHGWSHEIMLSYDFVFKGKEKIRSPRYF